MSWKYFQLNSVSDEKYFHIRKLIFAKFGTYVVYIAKFINASYLQETISNITAIDALPAVDAHCTLQSS